MRCPPECTQSTLHFCDNGKHCGLHCDCSCRTCGPKRKPTIVFKVCPIVPPVIRYTPKTRTKEPLGQCAFCGTSSPDSVRIGENKFSCGFCGYLTRLRKPRGRPVQLQPKSDMLTLADIQAATETLEKSNVPPFECPECKATYYALPPRGWVQGQGFRMKCGPCNLEFYFPPQPGLRTR